MKKTIITSLLIIAVAASLLGCGAKKSDSGYTDGSYHAEVSDTYAETEGHGWKGYVDITIAGGKITQVDFDYTNPDGALKSAQTAEEYPMEPHPSEWIPTLEESGKKATSADALDSITGATISSGEFKELYAAALALATAGTETTTIIK